MWRAAWRWKNRNLMDLKRLETSRIGEMRIHLLLERFHSGRILIERARPSEAAEEVKIVTSAAEAGKGNKGLTAALKALRHPNPDFFRKLFQPCQEGHPNESVGFSRRGTATSGPKGQFIFGSWRRG
jgi:hypothetical protein